MIMINYEDNNYLTYTRYFRNSSQFLPPSTSPTPGDDQNQSLTFTNQTFTKCYI